MSVTVQFECDGCSTKASGTKPIRKEFVSVSGRSYGFGSARYMDTVAEVAPEGWWPFDPYTYLCYCPECRAKIEDGGENE